MAKRVAILTGGGDCPGLNAVIRAVTKSLIHQCNAEVIGIEDGYLGLIEKRVRPLDWRSVAGIIPTVKGADYGLKDPNARLVKAIVDKSTFFQLYLDQDAEETAVRLQMARDVYTRRQEGVSIWVLPSSAIVASDPGEKSSYFRLHSFIGIGTARFALYSLLKRDPDGQVRPVLRTLGTE